MKLRPEEITQILKSRIEQYDVETDLSGAPHGLALLDVLPLAEERGADVVLLEVEGEADDAVLELEHFQGDRVLEAVGTGDAVTHLQDGPDLCEVGLDVVMLDPILENRGDLFGTKLHGFPFIVRRMA